MADEPIQQAFDVLGHLSADEKARRLAEIREKAIRDEAKMLAYARKEGWSEGQIEDWIGDWIESWVEGWIEGWYEKSVAIARRLLARGDDIEEIAALTEFDVETVRALQQSET